MINIYYNECMLSPRFYSQITTCPTCKGFGTEEEPNLSKRISSTCRECNGWGVFLSQSEQTFIWGMPSFVDFKKRAGIRTIKIALLIFVLLILFIIYNYISTFRT